MTAFLLIRHASFDGVGRVIKGRSSGVPLSDSGRAEADRLAERMKGIGITTIYSSPLERAVQTSVALAGRLKCPIVEVPALTEIDWGTWTGKSLDELQGDAEFERFKTSRSVTRIPGGESMQEVQVRAARALDEIRRSEPSDARLAVVTHADVLRALFCHYLGMPIDNFLRVEVPPACVSVIDMRDDRVVLRGINLAADLGAALH